MWKTQCKIRATNHKNLQLRLHYYLLGKMSVVIYHRYTFHYK